MSLTHLGQVFAVPIKGYDVFTPFNKVNIERPESIAKLEAAARCANPEGHASSVDCAYCGSEIAGSRCQSCGAPRRRQAVRIASGRNQITADFERAAAAVRAGSLSLSEFLSTWGDASVETSEGLKRVHELLPSPSGWELR